MFKIINQLRVQIFRTNIVKMIQYVARMISSFIMKMSSFCFYMGGHYVSIIHSKILF